MASSVKAAVKHAIDWAFIFANSNPAMKKQVMDTMVRNEELKRLIQEAKATRPVLKWDHYASVLRSADLSFLELSKKSASEYKPSPLNQEQLMLEIDQEKAKLSKKADEFEKELETDIAQVKSKLSIFESLGPVDTLTMSDIHRIHPEYKEEFDERIRQDFWSFDQSPADLEAALAASKKHHH